MKAPYMPNVPSSMRFFKHREPCNGKVNFQGLLGFGVRSNLKQEPQLYKQHVVIRSSLNGTATW